MCNASEVLLAVETQVVDAKAPSLTMTLTKQDGCVVLALRLHVSAGCNPADIKIKCGIFLSVFQILRLQGLCNTEHAVYTISSEIRHCMCLF